MKYMERMIAAARTPSMIAAGVGVAILFIIGGLVLYGERDLIVRGLRWPGITCALLGCVSLVSKVFQYLA